jgi:hypothetical protein
MEIKNKKLEEDLNQDRNNKINKEKLDNKLNQAKDCIESRKQDTIIVLKKD